MRKTLSLRLSRSLQCSSLPELRGKGEGAAAEKACCLDPARKGIGSVPTLCDLVTPGQHLSSKSSHTADNLALCHKDSQVTLQEEELTQTQTFGMELFDKVHVL